MLSFSGRLGIWSEYTAGLVRQELLWTPACAWEDARGVGCFLEQLFNAAKTVSKPLDHAIIYLLLLNQWIARCPTRWISPLAHRATDQSSHKRRHRDRLASKRILNSKHFG